MLEELAKREISGQTRVNLRRTFVWNDFKEARMRKRIVPEDLVKVVFLGEPAIDDAGLRREFSAIFFPCYTIDKFTLSSMHLHP